MPTTLVWLKQSLSFIFYQILIHPFLYKATIFPYDVDSPLPMVFPNIHLYVMFIKRIYTMKLPSETSMSVIRNDIIV